MFHNFVATLNGEVLGVGSSNNYTHEVGAIIQVLGEDFEVIGVKNILGGEQVEVKETVEKTNCEVCNSRCTLDLPVMDDMDESYYLCRECFYRGIESGEIKLTRTEQG